MIRTTGFLILAASPFLACAATPEIPAGMALIPGGEFTMGTDDATAFVNERPAHRVVLKPFLLDTHPVTNAEFAKFVAATGYRTTAEKPVDWEAMKKELPPGTPKPPEAALRPGTLVFREPKGRVDTRRMSWWDWVNGADWRHPEGPDSDLKGRERHPVVHISWHDAEAYAKWAGKRLPTEAEWEFAAHGGTSTRYWWGDALLKDGKHMANTFQGDFPAKNSKDDGFAGTAPVGSFPANGYGLYDMAGNVWNWCADSYRADAYADRVGKPPLRDPQGPDLSRPYRPIAGDPSPPDVPGQLRRVTKGGSFLCHPEYCESYRPSARRGVPPDTATSHIGFRCAKDLPEPLPPAAATAGASR